ncbi:LRR receptor-like serine/threonine-protein kinase [Perkinsela sp. CCAP 1560/4]|nr:LRR receptor-like serine/threonine-protein kinase [Perkinsela sp. CCAP 1560/4]|eukprot:KNH06592.1 LRR receptor-like serine/threonine-protein kinase [Perkinsela sp. CCAP 1560/4]
MCPRSSHLEVNWQITVLINFMLQYFIMFSLWTLTLIAADVSGTPTKTPLQYSAPWEWQAPLMKLFYSQISKEAIEKYSMMKTPHEFCDWQGITCFSKIITKVMYSFCDDGNFDIHSLPPTVTSIIIEHCYQRYALHTRSLPKALGHCHLNNNEICGSVELRTLPENLVNLDLSYNQLDGLIDLTNLPKKLEIFMLQGNAIKQSVVLVGRLPEDASIILAARKNPKNQIGGIYVLDPEGLAKAKCVFRCFPAERIHSA